jgi:hypothetical protein
MVTMDFQPDGHDGASWPLLSKAKQTRSAIEGCTSPLAALRGIQFVHLARAHTDEPARYPLLTIVPQEVWPVLAFVCDTLVCRIFGNRIRVTQTMIQNGL